MTWEEKFTPEEMKHILWLQQFLDGEKDKWLKIMMRDTVDVYRVRLESLGHKINTLRANLRKEKNYELSDRLRDILKEAHIPADDKS